MSDRLVAVGTVDWPGGSDAELLHAALRRGVGMTGSRMPGLPQGNPHLQTEPHNAALPAAP